ncbi:molybdopterin-dependent oxidoreductase [Ramlibacter sp. AW1]|uniref:Molybdopterin-dependent oxidoreductase n=1 Tax=Ramlibacter aurantiacus TaxID=2801330 RepID=A0A936ZGC7_9BURK|nr:molybdopterin cofactor-binding domain-containing protein [Ramlibacter aurantiacus]MBL0420954.1 molybdopterin-dependent oxidoreductase [Ramlibacter aurantiacus]
MSATAAAKYVGQYTQRREDPRLLSGGARFVDDIHLEGMLHASILRSPVAHGRIRGIDRERALVLPGVRAIYTAQDIAAGTAEGMVPRVPVRLAGIPELQPFRQPVIAEGIVRYVGEPVAIVIADTPARAEDAAAAIVLDIEALPAVASWEASARGDTLLFAGADSNRAVTYTATKGDAQAVQGAYRRRETLGVQRHSAQPMETRGLVAEWDDGAGRMVVYGSTKVPFFNRATLADALSLPKDRVDMIEVDVGGGFGVRGEFYPEDFLVPFAARALGRPVKWIEDRLESLLGTNHSREMVAEVEIVCQPDGRILALRGQVKVDAGAYMRTSGPVPSRNVTQFLCGPYDIAHVDVRTEVYLTNKGPIGSYRGPGRFEADFFRERLFDMAASDLGIDPVEFRRINLVKPGQMPYPIAVLDQPRRAEELDSGDYLETLDRCLLEFGWDDKRQLQGRLVDGKYHGMAVGCFIEGGGAGTKETARISIGPDGTIELTVGSVDLGQGMVTVMSQIAADALQVPIECIRVRHGSTNLLQEGFGSHHSRSTIMGGSAVLTVANELKEKVRATLAEQWQCAAEQIELSRGLRASFGDRSASRAELGQLGLGVDGEFRSNTNTYAYGAAAAHVTVDPETGRVELLDYFTVEDIGRIINPLTAKGQAVGAVVQGLGGVFLEHLAYDADGQFLAGSLADYLMPSASDFPRIRAMELENHPSPLNPLGAKGAGEGGIIPVGGLLANAIAAALASLKVQPKALPLTPCTVWSLIHAPSEPTPVSKEDEPTLLQSQELVPASVDRVWQGLNDPAVLQQCIPGCEQIEQESDTDFAITLLAAVGPVKMRFKGKLRLFDLNPPRSYSLAFEGKGGFAGSAKGTATVKLTPEGDHTRLSYRVASQIEGKLAQVGSRLIDGVARQTAKEFFDRFNRVLSAGPASPAARAPSKPLPWRTRLVAYGAASLALAVVAAAYFILGR